MKKNQFMNILFGIFAAIGILMLCFSIFCIAGGIAFFSVIPLFMGIIFSLVGFIPLIISAKKNKRQKNLLTNGRVLYATVDEITWNGSMTVNGQNPYLILCSYKDEYQDVIYRFKSNNLWIDPIHVFPVGSTIEVYVDPNDYSNYYVNAEKTIEAKIVDYT